MSNIFCSLTFCQENVQGTRNDEVAQPGEGHAEKKACRRNLEASAQFDVTSPLGHQIAFRAPLVPVSFLLLSRIDVAAKVAHGQPDCNCPEENEDRG